MCLTRTYAESQLASCTDGSCRVHGKPKPCSVRQSNGTSSLLALSRIDPEMMGIPEGNSDRALPASRTKPNGRQCQCGHPAHLRQTDCSRQINRITPSMRSPQPSADTIRVSTPTSIGYNTVPSHRAIWCQTLNRALASVTAPDITPGTTPSATPGTTPGKAPDRTGSLNQARFNITASCIKAC